MLTLRELQCIRFVIEAGTFGRAAKLAGISQSALSQAIASAEKKCGVKFFQRDKHRVSATEVGRLAAERARVILNDVTELESELEARRTARLGRVSFGIAPIPASIFLTPALTNFTRRHPNLYPSFVVDYWPVLAEALLRGEISFFIAGRNVMLNDRRLVRRIFHKEDLLVVGRPGHPLARSRNVPVSEFVRYPLITHRRPIEFAERIGELCTDASDMAALDANVPAATMQDLRPYFPVVENTDYLMFSARATFREMLAAGRLVRIGIDGVSTDLTIEIVTRARDRQNAATSHMIESFDRVRASINKATS